MIVTSNIEKNKWALYAFLRDHGVGICRSEDFQAIGRLNAVGELMGVIGYNGFCGKTCMLHSSGDGNWVNRQLLWAAFDYPFNQVGVVQIFGCASDKNEKAIRLNKHVGFKILHIIPEGWAVKEDMIVFTMRREDCKWLEMKNELKVA